MSTHNTSNMGISTKRNYPLAKTPSHKKIIQGSQ